LVARQSVPESPRSAFVLRALGLLVLVEDVDDPLGCASDWCVDRGWCGVPDADRIAVAPALPVGFAPGWAKDQWLPVALAPCFRKRPNPSVSAQSWPWQTAGNRSSCRIYMMPKRTRGRIGVSVRGDPESQCRGRAMRCTGARAQRPGVELAG